MSLVSTSKEIWQAGVDAVDPIQLIRDQLKCNRSHLTIEHRIFELGAIENICVVGAGKATARMAMGLEEILRPAFEQVNIFGTVIVPASQVRPNGRIELISGRTSHANLPTPQAVEATNKIIDQVRSLGRSDLCIALISGGGSALLCAPSSGITLADKIELTNLLASAGASIEQLNSIRGSLSRIKRGGLARLCRDTQTIGLILSDVMSDSLEFIASGPTVISPPAEWPDLAAIFNDLKIEWDRIPPNVLKVLRSSVIEELPSVRQPINILIGNNKRALEGAANCSAASQFKVRCDSLNATTNTIDLAKSICETIVNFDFSRQQPLCLILGGEPTLPLVAEEYRGIGGRNQQLVLEVWLQLKQHLGAEWNLPFEFCFFSGGTDGEDGPTDAAGAWIESATFKGADLMELQHHADRNDAYPLFDRLNQLHQPGETGTNVCDLIVLLIQCPNGPDGR